MNSIGLLLILALYVLILFYIAHWAEKGVILNGQLIRISIRFLLYCTAWTYYGSIVAAESGLLPPYLCRPSYHHSNG
jgi:hypothetical protein